MGKDIIYVELAKAKIQDRRNIAISECSKGGFTIAQQLEVNEGNRTTSVFLKGAFHVRDVDGLINLRDALNVAIMEYYKSLEACDPVESAVNESEDNEAWDE